MTTNIKSAMQEHGRGALGALAKVIGVIVYTGALIIAGVRSYDLFARTLPPDMLLLATIGTVVLELTACGLPLAIHYWTSPGQQRMVAFGFYGIDLVLIIANGILDSSQNAGTILPSFMQFYGTYVMPAVPVACMVGWGLLWLLDPTTREHDMRAAVRAATREALFGRIIEETANADITAEVEAAARLQVREIVGETLARAPRALPAPTSSSEHGATVPAGQAVGASVYRNGTEARAKVEAVEAPKD